MTGLSSELCMKRALALARRGRRLAHPNPMVGAVVAKDGKILAEGWHAAFGGAHAEVVALARAGKRSKGATLFVTLEPCATFGKTPPCVTKIIESGIKRVVVASQDPNPVNHGKGLRRLKEAGIRVEVGVLEAEAKTLNEKFWVAMTKRRPFISVKMAMSLDGRVATDTGNSKWISSRESRKWVHELRAEHDAVMVGTSTLRQDKARLNIRQLPGRWREPKKIVLDAKLKLALTLPVFQVNRPSDIVVVSKKGGGDALAKKARRLLAQGIEHVEAPTKGGDLNLREVLASLARKNITSVLVEGGSRLAGSLLDEGLIDRLYFFYAPILLGGQRPHTPFFCKGAREIKSAVKLKNVVIKKVGPDVFFTGIPVFTSL